MAVLRSFRYDPWIPGDVQEHSRHGRCVVLARTSERDGDRVLLLWLDECKIVWVSAWIQWMNNLTLVVNSESISRR
jgi:hypothetical protein